ncbi:hypothetical protein KIW84_UN0030 [Lathyrus oleraceus]|nr:hypothetical protein KIW84_UN0030 [Pisum sativum]
MGNDNNLSLLVGKAFTRSSGPQPHRNSTATAKENMSESCGSNDFPNAEGKIRKPNKGKAKVKEDLEEAFSTTQHFTTYQQPFKLGSSCTLELFPNVVSTAAWKQDILHSVLLYSAHQQVQISPLITHFPKRNKPKRNHQDIAGSSKVIDKLNYLSTKFSSYCQSISQGVTGLLFDYDTGKIVINPDKLIPDAAVKVQTYAVFYEDVIKHFDSLKFIFSKSWEKYLASKLKKEARCGSRSTERMSSIGKRMSISCSSEFIKNSKPRTSLTTVMNEAKELPFKIMIGLQYTFSWFLIMPHVDYHKLVQSAPYHCLVLWWILKWYACAVLDVTSCGTWVLTDFLEAVLEMAFGLSQLRPLPMVAFNNCHALLQVLHPSGGTKLALCAESLSEATCFQLCPALLHVLHPSGGTKLALCAESLLDATCYKLCPALLHVLHPSGGTKLALCAESLMDATWLILPVVICLSQRLSHACVMGVQVVITEQMIRILLGSDGGGVTGMSDGGNPDMRIVFAEIFKTGLNTKKVKDLKSIYRIWAKIFLGCIFHRKPSSSPDYLNLDQQFLLYCLGKRIRVDLPYLLFHHMWNQINESRSNSKHQRTWIPFGRLISDLLTESGLVGALKEVNAVETQDPIIGKVIDGKTLWHMKIIDKDELCTESFLQDGIASRRVPVKDYPLFSKADPIDIVANYILLCKSSGDPVDPSAYKVYNEYKARMKERRSKRKAEGDAGDHPSKP